MKPPIPDPSPVPETLAPKPPHRSFLVKVLEFLVIEEGQLVGLASAGLFLIGLDVVSVVTGLLGYKAYWLFGVGLLVIAGISWLAGWILRRWFQTNQGTIAQSHLAAPEKGQGNKAQQTIKSQSEAQNSAWGALDDKKNKPNR